MTARRIVEFDVDEAQYLGDGTDGVYWQTAQDDAGEWFVSVVVDSDTEGFRIDVYTDHGPFGSEEAAEEFAEDFAIEWCVLNDVEYD